MMKHPFPDIYACRRNFFCFIVYVPVGFSLQLVVSIDLAGDQRICIAHRRKWSVRNLDVLDWIAVRVGKSGLMQRNTHTYAWNS